MVDHDYPVNEPLFFNSMYPILSYEKTWYCLKQKCCYCIAVSNASLKSSVNFATHLISVKNSIKSYYSPLPSSCPSPSFGTAPCPPSDVRGRGSLVEFSRSSSVLRVREVLGGRMDLKFWTFSVPYNYLNWNIQPILGHPANSPKTADIQLTIIFAS